MRETIESIKQQFEALGAKLDPTSTQMLGDPGYASQLADCVAKTYVMLNNGMCEELTMCQTCAEQRDFLRDALERFEAIAHSGDIDADAEAFYFAFTERLGVIRSKIEQVLSGL